MPDWERLDPVAVSLPLDYMGKTLTIAQSTSPGGNEKQDGDIAVYPCSVTLYCGYTYESGLIAESFQTAVPTVIFLLAGLFLLAAFVWSCFRDKSDIGLACAAAAAFSWVNARMVQTSFSKDYFGVLPVDAVMLSRSLSLAALLAFLSSRMTGRRRNIGWVLTGMQAAAILADTAMQLAGSVSVGFMRTMYLLSLVILLAALGLGLWEQRKGGAFFRLFCLLTTVGIVFCGMLLVGSAFAGRPLAEETLQQLRMGAASFFLRPLALLMMAAALTAAVMEIVRNMVQRRAEARLLMQSQELARTSYEAMRVNQEQVMMLRHDMAKHFALLRQMTKETQVADYLDGLIAQNEKIRPVVRSGNEMLDIILNGKLTAAENAGIKIEITRTQAPDKLPLTDAELCSLMMNLLDNAMEAAAAPGVERRYIKLDMHIRNSYFVFTCENGTTPEWINKETAPERGLGLKVIRQIVERYGNLSNTEYGDDYYRVTVLLPLYQPLI